MSLMPSNKLLVSLLALSVSAAAQSAYTVHSIAFENPGPYSQAQLLAVSGVHAGAPATADTLQAGAQKLSDSGFFEDIGAQFGGTSAAVTAIFKLKPIPRDHMLPVGFQNFVWLSPSDIDSAIHAQVPLFQGWLPENTAPVDTVATALQQALAAKGIHARVEHETIEPTLDHPLRSIEYRVASPRPVISSIHLEGVTQDLVPLVQKSVNYTAHTGYNAGLAGILTSERILQPLLDAGYINASLSNLSLETPGPNDSNAPVVVHASLAAGDIYHLSALHFAGAPLMTADAFAAGAKLHPGDIASRKALIETLTPLDEAYRKHGYLDVIIKADPAEDATAHQVAYTISVVPGEQYHLSKVTAEGLDPAAQADFDAHFQLHPGDIYNPVYVAGFIKNNTALKTLAPYTGTFKSYSDPNTHTTELVVTFFRGPTINVH